MVPAVPSRTGKYRFVRAGTVLAGRPATGLCWSCVGGGRPGPRLASPDLKACKFNPVQCLRSCCRLFVCSYPRRSQRGTTIRIGESRTYQAGARRSCLRQFASSDLTNRVARVASSTLRKSCRSAAKPRNLNRSSQSGLEVEERVPADAPARLHEQVVQGDHDQRPDVRGQERPDDLLQPAEPDRPSADRDRFGGSSSPAAAAWLPPITPLHCGPRVGCSLRLPDLRATRKTAVWCAERGGGRVSD